MFGLRKWLFLIVCSWTSIYATELSIQAQLNLLVNRVTNLENEVKTLKQTNVGLQELIQTKEVDEDIQYLLAKNEEMMDQLNAVETRVENGGSNGDVNVNFSGLAESVADLLMTMSKSSNGSIVINKPETESVSLLGQFKSLQRNIAKIKLNSDRTASDLEQVKSELNRTKNDLTSELSIVALKIKENLNGTATFPATCQEYFDRGTRTNGTYKIRPSLELHSFFVECEFNNENGVTLLRPKNWKSEGFVYPENNSQRCTSPNCFTKSLNYGVSVDQMEALADASTNCEQEIQHTCKNHRLTGVSSWTGRDGVKNKYWHGDHKSAQTGCQCHANQNCNRSYNDFSLIQCNCDNTLIPNAVDIGVLSSLSKETVQL